jgi:hypothetical protein
MAAATHLAAGPNTVRAAPALEKGVADASVGDIAQDVRQRSNSNPNPLEREPGSQ